MRRIFAVSAVALVAGVSGCSESSDPPSDPNIEACNAYAFYLQEADGLTEDMDRATTVDQVRYELLEKNPDSENEPDEMIETGLLDMERTVDDTAGAWELASDTFVGACQEYGWTVEDYQ